jgi:hypothetical protein
VPLVTRIASALGHWLGESFGGNLRLAPDLDEVPALSMEREALWKRVGEAGFLTDDEKRAAAGYEPLPAASLTTLLAKYSPDQPRVPAGNSDGGQWTSGGGGSGDASSDDEGDQEFLPENVMPVQWGHHYEPKAVIKSFEDLSPEARDYFMKDVTGPLKAERHGNSKEHMRYNEAVKDRFERFFKENNIKPQEMTRDEAKRLSNEIKNSKDPRIRDFNTRIWMKEIIRLLRRR